MDTTWPRTVRALALVTFLLVPAYQARASALDCRQLPMLYQVYLRLHYTTHDLTDSLKTASVEQFLKILDPSKTLLLESDVATLRKVLRSLFDDLPSGKCLELDLAHQQVLRRLAEDEKQVKALLSAKGFKLDDSVELVVDTDKRPRPTTPQERAALLPKLVQFQLANLLLTGASLDEAKKELIHRYELVTRRITELAQKGELPTLLARAFATSLDPHTAFLSSEDLEDFQIGMRLSLEGIGAALTSRDGFTVIEELIPGGSADRLNVLKPKDKIVAVAQQGQKPVSVVDMDLREVVRMIRGKKGTSVTLTILRQGATTQTFDVTCVRDKVDISDAAAKITYETRTRGNRSYTIGVIDLASFYGGQKEGRSSSGDVKKLLLEARAKGAQGVVLDLSRNGGGLLDEAVKVAGLFLRKGAIVAARTPDGKLRTQEDEDADTSWSGPLLVLTSHMSASASEILAGALKDYRRAIVAGGDRTFGKGTVQVLTPIMGELGAIKITTGMYFLPGGKSTQRAGVKADIPVPSAFNDDEVGESRSENSLPPESTQPFLSADVNDPEPAAHWKPVDDRMIATLAAASGERVRKDADLVKTVAELEEARKKGSIKLADMLKKASKTDQKATFKERIKTLEAPFLRESVNIMADWLALP